MFIIKEEPELIIEADDQEYQNQCCDYYTNITWSNEAENEAEEKPGKVQQLSSTLLGLMSSVFKCGLCNDEYATEQTLDQHRETHPFLKIKLERCDEKNYFNENKNRSGELVTLSTKIDSDKLNTLNKTSIVQHSGVKESKSRPDKLEKKISSKKVPSVRKKSECEVCGKEFFHKAALKEHLMRHAQTKLFKCNECVKTFMRKYELDRHMPQHTGIWPFVCTICDRGFSQQFHLDRHVPIHTGARKFKCDKCDCSYKRSDHLQSHLMLHNEKKQMKCDKCDLFFNNKKHLKRHIQRHNNMEGWPFVCDICKKGFRRLGNFKTHYVSHSK